MLKKIDYNINFKNRDLYRNLRHALAQTMLYYYILYEVQDVIDEVNEDIQDENNEPNDIQVNDIKDNGSKKGPIDG